MPTCHQKVLCKRSKGLLIASLVLCSWVGSLVGLLLADRVIELVWPIVPIVLLRTLLQTGLFITAHDAMHGSIMPTQPRLSANIGRLMLWLYAFLSYDACRQRHFQHHATPTQARDPDFCSDQQLLPWYWHFMREYLAEQQGWQVIGGIAIVLGYITVWLPSQLPNLLLFWLLPLMLSSGQLFYFGIYLPHRQTHGALHNQHFARSLAAPPWLSFLMCYHFGYHWEHHEYPHLPWYELPTVRPQKSDWQAIVQAMD